MRDYMARYQVQLGASYPLSVAAAEHVAAGHRAAEALLGAGPGEVAIGPSTTANAQLLARDAGAAAFGAASPAPVGNDLGARLDRAYARIAAHEEALVAPLLTWLAARPGVRLIGPASPDRVLRVPTVAFSVDGRHASEIPPRLEAHRIAARWGHFYAPRAIAALGLAERGGVVRISLAHYNTAEEVERAIAALAEIV